jgi:tripartite-type tricarboxylate transporter receptor subunit TctC
VAKAAFDEKAVADFFRGKTIKIIVGSSAGGGFDLYSRLISRHLGRFVPGAPSVIVENMEGAGSRVAANHVYGAAPKDGTVIGSIIGAQIALGQLFGASGVQVDMARFQYLGSPARAPYAFFVHQRAGVSKLEDLIGPSGKEVAVGATVPGDTTQVAPTLLKEVLGAKIKVITGYQGTAPIRLALERGEVDGLFNSWSSVKSTSLAEVQRGEWLVLAQMADEPMKDLPGRVPTIPEIAKTEEQKQMLRFGTSVPNDFNRPYVVPPETPADRVRALQAALTATFADKEFLADAERSKLDIDPLSGEQLTKLVTEFMGMPASIKDKLRPILATQ